MRSEPPHATQSPRSRLPPRSRSSTPPAAMRSSTRSRGGWLIICRHASVIRKRDAVGIVDEVRAQLGGVLSIVYRRDVEVAEPIKDVTERLPLSLVSRSTRYTSATLDRGVLDRAAGRRSGGWRKRCHHHATQILWRIQYLISRLTDQFLAKSHHPYPTLPIAVRIVSKPSRYLKSPSPRALRGLWAGADGEVRMRR